MTTRRPERTTWRRSSYSGSGQQDCVEVALGTPTVAVRDSKNLNGPVLDFHRANWSAFLSATKAGRFSSGRPVG